MTSPIVFYLFIVAHCWIDCAVSSHLVGVLSVSYKEQMAFSRRREIKDFLVTVVWQNKTFVEFILKITNTSN